MGNGFLEVLSARDISVGGLGVSVKHKFEGCDTNSEVDLIVTLGRARPFKTRGVIRHASNDFFGVQFTALAPEHEKAIEAYVATRLGRKAAG